MFKEMTWKAWVQLVGLFMLVNIMAGGAERLMPEGEAENHGGATIYTLIGAVATGFMRRS